MQPENNELMNLLNVSLVQRFTLVYKHHCITLSILFLAVGDFPEDVFTPEQRRHGAVLLHVLCVSVDSD